METFKVKSPAKIVKTRGSELQSIILDTLKDISAIVGGTLGPGGQGVLIERQEYGLPCVFTKDGVTVFRSLGHTDPIKHCIIDTVRDAALRTASEAGDGPQPLWSKILTPTGFITQKDVKVGMKICGTNQSVQTVLGVYPKGQKEIYKVYFDQNRMVECCEDHLWTVNTYYGTSKTLPLKEILKDYKELNADGTYRHRYFVPNETVCFEQNEQLPLDPYLVGVLIGDGSLSDSGSIELSLGKSKEHIISKLKLPDQHALTTAYVEAKNSFRVKIHGPNIKDLLEEIGLRNTNSYSKHIPQKYLLSSMETREQLLQGLIDTDGHINGRGLFEFSTVSEQLAVDFTFLCRSLGKPVYSKIHARAEGDGSYSNKPIFRFHELKGYKYGNKILDIVKTGEFTEMQCIKVSNPDNLYITDDFVATHNTTTVTILSESITRRTIDFCKEHPSYSPHLLIREMQSVLNTKITPRIKELSKSVGLVENRELAHAVATVSANGDTDLADSVLKAFDICGDEGNVTIIDSTGSPSRYEVEEIKGFPISMGFEESCAKFYPMFINNPATQKIVLDNPIFILYFGKIHDIQTILPLMESLNSANNTEFLKPHNVVIMATGFSEAVIADLANNMVFAKTINFVPLLVPNISPVHNAQRGFLDDVAAITGAFVFDPLTAPISEIDGFEGIGNLIQGEDKIYRSGEVTSFECGRYRSSIIGIFNPDMALLRADEVRAQADNAESELERSILLERSAKLTGGIAKIRVIGSSNGELKERRDRVDDAVCAVRGALKYGCLPAGGWTLIKIAGELLDGEDLFNFWELKLKPQNASQVLALSLIEPFFKLLSNIGMNAQDQSEIFREMCRNVGSTTTIYNCLTLRFEDAMVKGLVDSTPAVSEAVKNALSIATQMGTMGGVVVHPRKDEFEMKEARDRADFERAAAYEP